MMNPMHSTDFGHDLLFFSMFHSLGTLSLLLGIFLMTYWAVKHLGGLQIYHWGWTLIATGAALFLLGSLAMPEGRDHDSRWGNGMMGREQGERMDRAENESKGMSMDDMVQSLQDKTGDDFDQAFIEAMIVHHQGAIDMANAAQQSAGHDEIKSMANDIVSSQQQQIDQMRERQGAWGFPQ